MLRSFGFSLLVMSVGQRLCINFYVSKRKISNHFCVHTCTYIIYSRYFWSSLFNMDGESLDALDNQPTGSIISDLVVFRNYSCLRFDLPKNVVNYSYIYV